MQWKNCTVCLAGTGLVLSCILLMLGSPLSAETENPYQGPQAQTSKNTHNHDSTTVPGGSRATGLRIVDPKTGEMVSPPTPGVMSQRMVESMDTSDVGLYEEPDAAGGIMVDLQGRFHPMLKVPPELLKADQSEVPED